jgi:hypothetical protein
VGYTVNNPHILTNCLSGPAQKEENYFGGETETVNLKNLSISLALMSVFTLLGIVAGTLITQYMFPSTATVMPKAEVYFDDELFTNGQTLDWGTITRGDTWTTNLKVINTGVDSAKIVLAIENIPIGITYIWTPNLTTLVPGATAQANLEMIISDTATLGTYSLGTYYVRLYEVP